jgi:hypothetical protein
LRRTAQGRRANPAIAQSRSAVIGRALQHFQDAVLVIAS